MLTKTNDGGGKCTKCSMGQYSLPESSTCISCDPGKSSRPGDPICTACAAGQFRDSKPEVADAASGGANGTTREGGNCTDCAAGQFSAAAAATCTFCAAGQFLETKKGTACKVCPAGTFLDETGRTSEKQCTRCFSGSFNPVSGSPSADACSLCPEGRWGEKDGATTLKDCTICRGGTFSNTSGATTAQCSGFCPPGKYSDDGAAQCTACGQGKYQINANSFLCLSCLTKMTTLGEGNTECVCEKESYMNGNGTCIACPDDIICDKVGSTLEKMNLKNGTWRPSAESNAIYECPVKESCMGGNSTCKEGHTGVLCAVCEAGWSRRGSTSMCGRCPAESDAIYSTAGLAAGIIVVAIIVVLLDLRFGWSRAKGGSRVKLILNWYV